MSSLLSVTVQWIMTACCVVSEEKKGGGGCLFNILGVFFSFLGLGFHHGTEDSSYMVFSVGGGEGGGGKWVFFTWVGLVVFDVFTFFCSRVSCYKA